MNAVNKYNFILWESGATPDSTIESEYVFPQVSGDEVKFYINFDTPISSTITNWQIGIWIPDGAIVIPNIGTLSQDLVNETQFNLYAQLTLGVMPGPWYRIVIYDSADGNAIKYWSSPFQYTTVSTNTLVVKYRNEFNILNFEYENVTTFYNKVRIDAILGEPIPARDVTGYKTTSGHFVNAKSVLKKSKLLKTLGFDENAHDAASSMVHHDEIYIDDIRYYAEEENYEPETIPTEHYLYNGSVRLFLYDYTVVASNT